MKELQQLDIILRYLLNRDGHTSTLQDLLVKHFQDWGHSDSSYVNIVLEKLIDDEYVKQILPPEMSGMPIITKLTFKGIVFINQGGYCQESRNITQEQDRLKTLELAQMRNDTWIKRGTIIAAVFSGLFLLFDIWKTYKSMPHIFCWGH